MKTVHIQNSPIQNSLKHQKKVLKNSPIQNSPKPVEFLDLDLLAPTEIIYALKIQTGAIKDQRAKVGTKFWMNQKFEQNFEKDEQNFESWYSG